ncbi:hypothetical protein C496_09326 [Natronorubrum tibetense GA33]|uniref:Uncharacterized protein n=1 Tax=Natronorubrum tibetense GA33 TaxID=1114856 RepID=L9VX25_9EURY|nr:hypothetical protein C496_09326 [Natronorubrum tibetense GA33]
MATIGGSAGVLAAGTLAASYWSSDGSDESTVDGESAVLELTDDGLEVHGDPFDGDAQRPPVTFDIVNGRSEPVSVTLAADAFRLTAADATTTDDGRLVVGDGSSDRLESGARLANVVVELMPDAARRATERTITEPIAVTVDGDELSETEPELTLERPGFVVEDATLALRRVDADSVEHRWTLSGLDTGGVALEALRFDYTDFESGSASRFADAKSPSSTVAVDGTEREAEIERRTAERIDVALAKPLETDDASVEIRFGPPESESESETSANQPPDGEPGTRSGVTLELVGGGYSGRVEGVWNGS